MIIFVAYFLSIVVGSVIVNQCLYFIRKTSGVPQSGFKWLDFWIGGTERAIATTLYLLAQQHLPVFIGGWVALKFAANWKRQRYSQKVSTGTLISLIGNALSFSIAIASGWLVQSKTIAQVFGQ
ncbi:MAG: hypothetical protein ABI830_10690 [Pseudolabrys sp.]